MYWSLQQQVEDPDSFPSPADTATTTTPEASPAPSVLCRENACLFRGKERNECDQFTLLYLYFVILYVNDDNISDNVFIFVHLLFFKEMD